MNKHCARIGANYNHYICNICLTSTSSKINKQPRCPICQLRYMEDKKIMDKMLIAEKEKVVFYND